MEEHVLKDTLRYLGYRDTISNLPQDIKNDIKECYDLATTVIADHAYTSKVFTIDVNENYVTLLECDVTLTSSQLANWLKGCEKIVLVATTLGMPFEKMTKQLSVTNMSKSVIFDALGTALIELQCDQIEGDIKAKFPYFSLTARFSPGYGNLSLDTQKDFIRILEAQKKIGVTLTQANLMIPQKSVTFMVGLSRSTVLPLPRNCDACNLDCTFRTDDTSVGHLCVQESKEKPKNGRQGT